MSVTEQAVRMISLTLVAILISVAVIFLCGCASQQTEGQKESTSSEESAEAENQNVSQENADEQEEASLESEEAEEEEDELIEEAYKVENLMPVEEAEEETGILAADAGTIYVEGEILVTLSGNAKIKDIDEQLKFCEFIKESSLSEDMMITGSIDHEKVMKGSTGQAVMLLHTAEDVTVPQAIVALSDSRALRKAEPNYIMQSL